MTKSELRRYMPNKPGLVIVYIEDLKAKLELAVKALKKIEESDRMSYGSMPYHVRARKALEEMGEL